jgi:hypothetical protein
MSSSEVSRAQSLSRALESAQRGVGPDESAWRRAFGIAAPSERPCDGSSGGDCEVCREIARVKGAPE